MVGFRLFVLDHASCLNGTVANRPDGSVECVVEGDRAEVDRLITALHRGPELARVEGVEVLDEPFRGDLPPMTVRS